MKTIYAILSVMLFANVAHAEIQVWRSSYTETAEANVLIASGSIVFHGVDIGSGAANSYVFIYNNSAFTATVSTVAKIDLSANRDPQIYDIPLSSGLMYNKTGGAKINILWDWMITPQPGQENKGR